MFNNVENAIVEIQEEVTLAFDKYLQLLTLQNTDVKHDLYTNSIEVTVTYSLPNQEINKTSIGLITIQGTLPLYEELQ
jgi:hypothetical protein